MSSSQLGNLKVLLLFFYIIFITTVIVYYVLLTLLSDRIESTQLLYLNIMDSTVDPLPRPR